MSDPVVDAIHKLELAMTKQIGAVKSDLESQDVKLDKLIEDVSTHKELMYGPKDGTRPGLIQRTTKLEDTEKKRVWVLGAVAVAWIGAAADWFWGQF